MPVAKVRFLPLRNAPVAQVDLEHRASNLEIGVQTFAGEIRGWCMWLTFGVVSSEKSVRIRHP